MEELGAEKAKIELILTNPRWEYLNKKEVNADDREEAQAEAEDRKRKDEDARLEAERLAKEVEEQEED
eukprot:CAMPEP_0201283432 /NCGR_PEP_ID=MMETSP1317-20130820/8537_1 /ASSEMBLY_ACC=CAM_ASM_000770 /TAXON_ID=187299 /ORGANISM="Undescribed Undescribed, Strain Undescribed" /LENGTH=67 /DNA_ID=CAMNT_0047599657 /DNA_START=619 /DNA_END=825 /DNA_ORIENTATION=+